MDTVVMKYFRYDMRCIVDRWDLNVSFKLKIGEGQNACLRTFSNVPTFSSWGGCS